jgi:hypothetical protein
LHGKIGKGPGKVKRIKSQKNRYNSMSYRVISGLRFCDAWYRVSLFPSAHLKLREWARWLSWQTDEA